jgi:hypothetical protein
MDEPTWSQEKRAQPEEHTIGGAEIGSASARAAQD